MLRPGFTLFDLLVTIAIMTMVAALVVPSLSDADRSRLIAATSILGSDIELAQVVTVSDPARPLVVRFEPAEAKYWLAYADTPDDPIPRPDTGAPYLVIFGQGRAHSAAGVTLVLADIANETLTFLPQGGLADFTAQPEITVSLGNKWIKLAIAPTTGTITESAGAD